MAGCDRAPESVAFVEVDGNAMDLLSARRYLECAGKLGFTLRVRTGTLTAAVRLALEWDAASVMVDDVAANESGLADSRTPALLTPAPALTPRRFLSVRPRPDRRRRCIPLLRFRPGARLHLQYAEDDRARLLGDGYV